jgi:hypothetical protein
MARGNDNMSSKMAKKMRYVKDRCINAYWMLRTGKFKLIFKSIYIEIQHRVEDIRAWLYKGEELDDSQVPGSRFANKCKMVPPSYRPTTSQTSPSASLRTDSIVVAKELQTILANFAFQDNSNS